MGMIMERIYYASIYLLISINAYSKVFKPMPPTTRGHALPTHRFHQGGRHLGVGHSNTTPRLVELLGGKPNSVINEGEFDRLYIVTIERDGAASSVMMHYGKAYYPGQN